MYSLDLLERDVWKQLAAALFALLLATLTLRYVENPIRHGIWLRGVKNARVLGFAAATIVVAMIAAVTLLAREAYGPKTDRERLALRLAGQCRFGSPIEVLAWGDSHTMSWAPLLQVLQQHGEPVFLLRAMSSWKRKRTARRRAGGKVAELWGILPTIEHERQGHSGLASRMRQELLKMKQARHEALRQTSHGTDDRVPALASVLSNLQAAHVRVRVLLDLPELRYDLPICIYYHVDDPLHCGISRAANDREITPVSSAIKSIAAPFPSVRVVDTVNYFCDGTTCPALRDGHGTLCDDNHIAASPARDPASDLREDFVWLLGGE